MSRSLRRRLRRRDSQRNLLLLLTSLRQRPELFKGQLVTRRVLDLWRAGDLCVLYGDGGGEEAAAAIVDVLLVRGERGAALARVGAQFATGIKKQKLV